MDGYSVLKIEWDVCFLYSLFLKYIFPTLDDINKIGGGLHVYFTLVIFPKDYVNFFVNKILPYEACIYILKGNF